MWEEIEKAYRAGEHVTDIADRHGVSIVEIVKAAMDGGWFRAPRSQDAGDRVIREIRECCAVIVSYCMDTVTGAVVLETGWRGDKETVSDILCKMAKTVSICEGLESGGDSYEDSL
jgi:hypothetical protein